MKAKEIDGERARDRERYRKKERRNEIQVYVGNSIPLQFVSDSSKINKTHKN